MTAHHRVRREAAPGVWEVARPLADTSPLHRWRDRRRCGRLTGHCWHPEGLVDWWCCMCTAAAGGMPAQNCCYCTTVEEPAR